MNYLRETPVRNLPGTEAGKHFTHTLREDLGEDFEVFMPSMPNKQNADFTEWSMWFERHFTYLSGEVTLVGWSLGGMFLTKYLSEQEVPFVVNKLVLLGAPCGKYDSPDGNDCGNFQFEPSVLSALAAKVEKILILHSNDDFVVPVEAAHQYKTHLPNAELVIYEDKNHFLSPKFPELLTILR